jgi:tetratricopeptide (TPR) repeat protein
MPRVQIDPYVVYVGLGASVHHQLGDTATAEAWNAEILTGVDDVADPLNAVNAYQVAMQYRAFTGHRSEAVRLADRAIALATEHGIRANEAEARVVKGWMLRDADLVREGAAILADLGLRVSEPTHHLALAEIHCDADRIDEAEREVATGLAAAERSGEARHVAELYRTQGAAARRRGRVDAAETSLRKALEVAYGQESRLFALRAAADLGDLLAAEGRRDDARALLAPLCDGFVPDGQGPELDRARAIASALS